MSSIPKNKKLEKSDEVKYDSKKPYCNAFKSIFELTGNTINDLGIAVKIMGLAFSAFCEELNSKIEELKPSCISRITTGPIYRNDEMKSIIARANNRNNFDVKVKLIINSLPDGLIQTSYCQEQIIKSSHSKEFEVVDMSNSKLNAFSIAWEFTTLDDKPVCGNIHVFAAGRSDSADIFTSNSQLIPSLIFYHTHFTSSGDDPE